MVLDIANNIENINDILLIKPNLFNFYMDDTSENGNNVHQSPLWIRPNALSNCKLNDYTHVIGHTKQEGIKAHRDMILCDALNNDRPQYCTITDNENDEFLIKLRLNIHNIK
jgi:hypothetical protein